MPSRVLLVSVNRCTTPDPVFPLGLAHVNAALRRAGHQTRWLDALASDQSLPEVLTDFRPDFVGVSVRNIDDVLIRRRETYFGDLAALCETVRASHPRPIILGGSGFSLFPERLLELSGADYGIQGEGEESFPALLVALATGGDVSPIPGLVYRRDGEVAVNVPRPLANWAGVEAVDRPAVLVRQYVARGGMLNVQTQRGCVHTCCYCTYPALEGQRRRRRAPEIIAEEMAQLQAQGAIYAFIVDSVFNSSPQHVVETCEAIVRRGVTLRWGCFLRPQGLTSDLMALMARAGLAHIEFGSDSFCDRVLDAYGKRLTFDDVLRSSELAHAQGIEYCHYLICGGPGETPATLQDTFHNSERLPGGVVLAVVGMRIYPGTALLQRARHEDQVPADADLLEPAYYLAPGLTAEGVFETLHEFAARSPKWIPADPPTPFTKMVERLRSRGVVGPLWSYFPLVRRLWPVSAPAAAP